MAAIFGNFKNNLLNFRNGLNNFRYRHIAEDANNTRANHKVNNLEKRFLVWTGKYKTIEEVPTFVQQNVVERARNRMRIRIANYMMAATAAGCLLMVYLGKQDAKRGESATQRNLDWHRKYEEGSKGRSA